MASPSVPLPSQIVALLGGRRAMAPLRRVGFEVIPLESPEQALECANVLQERAVILASRSLRAEDCERFVVELRQTRPMVDVFLWAPDGDAEKVRAALKGGARDVVLASDPGVLAARVRQIVDDQLFLPQLQRLRRSRGQRFEGMVSRSPQMWDLFETCVRVAPTAASVLIVGETGTGKELLARAIHRRSGRDGRFVAVNCSALPEGLVDAELFGHEKGTFTGAVRAKKGLFRHAAGGTIFLDEIGNVPAPVQFSLLRVLQAGCIRPVGGHEEVPVDARVVAATSEPLEAAVARGDFREDLLYRLDVIRLPVPPLRHRSGDLIFLFQHFVKRFAKTYKLPRPKVLKGFLDALLEFEWPGNVRQLENLTERLVLTHSGEALRADHFFELCRPGAPGDLPVSSPPPLPLESSSRGAHVNLDGTLEENIAAVVEPLERAYFEGILRRYRGRVGLVAEHAGVNRRTVLRKLRALGLEKHEYRDG